MKLIVRLGIVVPAVACLVALVGALPAEAAVKPGAPTGVKAKVGYTSAILTWKAGKKATGYRLCLTTTSAAKKCAISTKKRKARTVKLTNLKPNGGVDYFVTVIAVRGNRTTKSKRIKINLAVAPVPAVTIDRGTTTSNVSWPATRGAYRYVVERSSSKKFTKSTTQVSTVKGTRYTAAGLLPAGTYYYRVKATNDTRTGAVSPATKARQRTAAISLSTATYNLCGQDKCIDASNAANILPWSSGRKQLAGTIARGLGADILATQENSLNDSAFASELPGYSRSSDKSAKIVYAKSSRFTKITSGWISMAGRALTTKAGQSPYTELPTPSAPVTKYAAWAELQDKATRTSFLVVDPHLESGKGVERDNLRYAQTQELLAKVKTVNTKKLPVVFAGDFNSNGDNADQAKYLGGFDGPRKAFQEAGYLDAFDIAGQQINKAYNSANQGRIDPPRGNRGNGDHIDKLYVTRGITVTRWESVVRLTDPDHYVVPHGSDHNPVRVSLTIPGLA